MSIDGVPAGGLKTVGQIIATNALTFQADQDGLAIAVALVSSHTPGAPVVDRQGKYLGFINEFDVMRALDADKDLSKMTAEEIMRKDRLIVTPSTKIADAAKRMEEHSVLISLSRGMEQWPTRSVAMICCGRGSGWGWAWGLTHNPTKD